VRGSDHCKSAREPLGVSLLPLAEFTDAGEYVVGGCRERDREALRVGNMNASAELTFGAFVFSLIIATTGASAATAEPEDIMQSAIWCNAYALIQTRDYPETVKVYEEHKPPANAAEQARARTGMTWTNRAYFADQMAAKLFHDARGRPATNGDLSPLRGQAQIQILAFSPSKRKQVAAFCKSIFDAADHFCEGNLCIAKP
jgi:hypothetical protein